MANITKKQKENLGYTIDTEGFDYAFCHSSSWDEIKDEQFQKLKNEYIQAKENLENYLLEQDVELGVN